MTNYEDLTPEQKAQIEEAAGKFDQLMDKLDEIASPSLYREVVDLRAEVKRLTEALDASNKSRDDLAQKLSMAQSETRALRIELQRLSAPNGGVA